MAPKVRHAATGAAIFQFMLIPVPTGFLADRQSAAIGPWSITASQAGVSFGFTRLVYAAAELPRDVRRRKQQHREDRIPAAHFFGAWFRRRKLRGDAVLDGDGGLGGLRPRFCIHAA